MAITHGTSGITVDDSKLLCRAYCSCGRKIYGPTCSRNSDQNARRKNIATVPLVYTHVTDGGKRRRKLTSKAKKIKNERKERKKLKKNAQATIFTCTSI